MKYIKCTVMNLDLVDKSDVCFLREKVFDANKVSNVGEIIRKNSKNIALAGTPANSKFSTGQDVPFIATGYNSAIYVSS